MMDIIPNDREEISRAEPPQTEIVDPENISLILGYREMLALAGMFERWALTEENITPERRTRLLQMCVDYEAIAAWCGPSWVAPDPDPRDPLCFLARLELSDQLLGENDSTMEG